MMSLRRLPAHLPGNTGSDLPVCGGSSASALDDEQARRLKDIESRLVAHQSGG